MNILRRLTGLALALCMLIAMLPAGAQLVPVPPLNAHVTDLAGMLSAQQRTALDNVLADYEAKTGSQIAVLLMPSTAPEAIEQYGIRVVDAWKLGRKGVDDGVLLLVAKDNPPALRRLRIEAGRGVQGVLTDAQSKRVLQDVIAPHFRQNDYYGGLVAGVGAIAALLDQEAFPAPSGRPDAAAADIGPWWPLLLFGMLVLAALLRSRGPRRLHHGGWGRDAAGVLLGSALGHGAGHHSGGNFGGFGGGGFSGGGGGFDGGGASGDW